MEAAQVKVNEKSEEIQRLTISNGEYMTLIHKHETTIREYETKISQISKNIQ